MKKWALLYFLLLSSFGYAQNWSGMYPGATHFYSVNGSNTLTTIYQDTFYTIGNDNHFIPKLLFRDVYNENLLDSNCFFWGGPQCQWKKDNPTIIGNKIKTNTNSATYFNFQNDSLVVNFNLNINDTQVVFRSNNHVLKYKLIFNDTLTVLNTSDSLKKYLVIYEDTLGNLISSPLQNDTIIYSKNLGLINGFSISDFPNTITEIELYGIRNPNFGFVGLTYADAYNYQVGDLIETTFGSPTVLYRHLYKVLSRTDTPNDVVYTMKDSVGTASPPYPPANYNYSSSIISKTYSKLDFIDLDYFENSSYSLNFNYFNGCWSGIKLNYSRGDCFDFYCTSLDCYGANDCFQTWSFSGSYVEGIGLFNETGYQNGMGGYSTLNTSYIYLSGIECGSSLILSTNEIENNFHINIFPNPANELLTIQSDKNIQNGKIILTDLSGREIASQNLNQQNSNQIDISKFSNGIYLLKIYSGNTVLKIEKLVIEK